MFAALIRGFVKLTGWTPVGRHVQIYCAEGPASPEINRACGTIVQVHPMDSGRSEAIIVSLDQDVCIEKRVVKELLLVPRHKGYGALTLVATPVLVYVFPARKVAGDEFPPESDMVAMAEVRLFKSGSGPTR